MKNNTVNFKNRGISSLELIISLVENIKDKDKIKKIDLSHNFIDYTNAKIFLDYAYENLPNLEVLDLSSNKKLTEGDCCACKRGYSDNYEEYNKSLLRLAERVNIKLSPTFKEINAIEEAVKNHSNICYYM